MIKGRDIARKANVSVSTVSRVFSNDSLVNQETKEKVLRVAAELGYVPNVNAKFLKLAKTNLIGYCISDINNPFYLRIPTLLSKYELIQDKHFYISFSNENSNTELDNIQSFISRNVESILFIPTGECKELVSKLIISNHMPTLQLFRKKFDNIDSLTVDDEYGSYLATKNLLLNGHHRILLIDYDVSINTGREQGYIKAFNEFGYPIKKSNILKVNITGNFANQIAKTMDSIKPTAVIPVSSLVTYELLNYMKSRGLKIKDDISIIAYDDFEYASYLNISVITQPYEELTEMINFAINKRITDFDAATEHYSVKPYFINRDSIKRIK